MARRILLVDDEPLMIKGLKRTLEQDGYETDSASDGEEALKKLNSEHYDLVLLDVMLPKLSGIEVCQIVRETSDIPIIMLTAKGEDMDKILGLEYGADDYMTKPFSPRVLIARIRARLRKGEEDADEPVSRSGITLRCKFHEAEIDGNPIQLTSNEFSMLKIFLSNPGRVFSRDEIIDKVHGSGYAVTDRAIDVQIVGLRKKLGDKARIIETVRGVGYRCSRAENI